MINESIRNKYLGIGGGSGEKFAISGLTTQIKNIVSSYDGYFDQLTEMIQNSLDSLETKWGETGGKFEPLLKIYVDQASNRFAVTDNGTGVSGEYFDHVFKPNFSVKKYLGHENARGSKGAAMIYLQFYHSTFEFQTIKDQFKKRYKISNGPGWVEDLNHYISSDEKPFPELKVEEDSSIVEELQYFDSGTKVEVTISDPESVDLIRGIFAKSKTEPGKKVAINRLTYLLRTRTGVGYVSEELDEFWKELKVSLEVKFKDAQTKTEDVEVGFLYPHLLHTQSATFLNPKMTDLFYQFIDKDNYFIRNRDELKDGIYKVNKFREILDKYSFEGYVSYANRNTLYEEILEEYCDLRENSDLDENEQQLRKYLITTGVNGGFIVAVKGFPNGTLQPFIQRGGSEDKSRTFVIMNFQDPYEPDYGRKNLSHDCYEFTNELCKNLMKTARKLKLKYMTGDMTSTPHGATGLPGAKETLKNQQNVLRDKHPSAPFTQNASLVDFEPKYETEVPIMFLDLIISGNLKGYNVYGVPSKMMLDGLFDYKIKNEEGTSYKKDSCELGIDFGGKSEVEFRDQWLEYKLASDQLVDNLEAKSGDSSKKYFDTIDLLVCYRVDDQTEGYNLEEITGENFKDRRFYGVTHLIKKNGSDHIIQVISLSDLIKKIKT